MSENYTLYRAKMEELRVSRAINRPLLIQLHELFAFVAQCERRWKSF
jgi:hypothetical protein